MDSNDNQDIQQHIANGYTPEMVQALIAIQDKSWAYTWLHRESARVLTNWYDQVSYVSIFLGILTGASIFITASNGLEAYYIRLVTGIVSIIAAFVSAYLKYEDYGQEIASHKIASGKYSRVYANIIGQLNTKVTAQQQAHHFYSTVTYDFDAIYNTAPDIEEEVFTTYTRKLAHKRAHHPIEVEADQPDLELGFRESNRSSRNITREASRRSDEASDRFSKRQNLRKTDYSRSRISGDTETESEDSEEQSKSVKSEGRRPEFRRTEFRRNEGTELPAERRTELPGERRPEFRRTEGTDQTEAKLRRATESTPKPGTASSDLGKIRDVSPSLSELQLQKYLKNYQQRNNDTTYSQGLVNLQLNRLRMNSDKCYISPIELDQFGSSDVSPRITSPIKKRSTVVPETSSLSRSPFGSSLSPRAVSSLSPRAVSSLSPRTVSSLSPHAVASSVSKLKSSSIDLEKSNVIGQAAKTVSPVGLEDASHQNDGKN